MFLLSYLSNAMAVLDARKHPCRRMRLPEPEKGGGVAEKKNGPESLLSHLRKVGAAGRNRTHDPLVRSQVLYPAELQPPEARIIAALDDLANPPIR